MTKLSSEKIAQFAQSLHSARHSSKELEPFSKTEGEYSLEDSYKIQKLGIDLRLADGEKIVGYKMGLTSKAKMDQMGLHTPIYGVLTDTMQIKNTSEFSLQERIHPKTEPEIYFITNQEISSRLALEDVPSVCDKIGVALEILDSRYMGFKYFSLPDVIADNASSSHFVLGDFVTGTERLDWPNIQIELISDEKTVEAALGSAILGHPFQSLCALVDLLISDGKTLPAGSIVLAGAATTAIELKAEQWAEARLQGVGSVSFHVKG
jgi:2-oxo-3-hexenedioate decarboxylase